MKVEKSTNVKRSPIHHYHQRLVLVWVSELLNYFLNFVYFLFSQPFSACAAQVRLIWVTVSERFSLLTGEPSWPLCLPPSVFHFHFHHSDHLLCYFLFHHLLPFNHLLLQPIFCFTCSVLISLTYLAVLLISTCLLLSFFAHLAALLGWHLSVTSCPLSFTWLSC